MESNTKILHPTKRPKIVTLDEFAYVTEFAEFKIIVLAYAAQSAHDI
jgi:hypothetical protein